MHARPALFLLWLTLGSLCTVGGSSAALAIMSGQESRMARSGDEDYAAGKEAFAQEDWGATISHLLAVVERRPWHDNAHAMLGFAFRRQGDYVQALLHYWTALDLNPRHRGALEYLAEAYLELGRKEDARETAERLGEVCRFVVMTFDGQGWNSACEEFDLLREHFAAQGIDIAPLAGDGGRTQR
jgi:cytochrome c-type biogenesis protein CcmH/NrfG